MILVLSGEGPTDIGTTRPTEAGWKFAPGPMAWIIDKLLNRSNMLNFSLLELHASGSDCVCFLNKADLASLRPAKPIFLPRSNDAPGYQYFAKSAFLLGRRAKDIAAERNSPAIAVFFRDADATRSTPKAEWQGKFDSMLRGFEIAEFPSGVPMVPRPKSEAWMLCGLLKREDPSRNYNWLEDASGNDASPNSLKASLESYLTYAPTTEQQAELVSGGRINPELIDLPSFTAFSNELDRAYANAAPPPQ
jgi:hypothetical protein